MDLLNKIKICFNTNLIELFYDEVFEFYSSTIYEYAYNYAKKIKQISFLDSDIDYNSYIRESDAYFVIKFLIINSKVEIIEDRYYKDNNTTIFLKIFQSKYNIKERLSIFENKYKGLKMQCDIMDIIKELKSYSLYFDFYDSKIIQNVCSDVIFNGKNIEELEITGINKSDSACFINSLKNLKKLKSLIISRISDDKNLLNEISKIIKENTLQKLSINVNLFKEAENLINKHSLSLISLSLKINSEKDNNLLIAKTLQFMENLRKLKLICTFPILDKNNINFFSLNKVNNLEISLCMQNDLFDLNCLFKNVPNLTKLHFNGINFTKKKFINNNMALNNINSKYINKLRKLKFTHGNKNASLFILLILSKFPNKTNIKKLSIDNCSFNDSAELNELIKNISLYTNLISLSLNYLSLKKEITKKILYTELQNLKKLESFSFLGLKYDEWNIKEDSFISFINKNYLNLFEIGLSSYNLNPRRTNNILFNLKNIKFLTKIKIFNGYNKNNFLYDKSSEDEIKNEYEDECNSESYEKSASNEESEDMSICRNLIDNYILIGKIMENYLIDIRNISFYKCYYNSIKIYQPKIQFSNYFDIEYGKDEIYNNNKKEEFYLYQKIFSNVSRIIDDILCLNYSDKKLSFIIKQRIEEREEEEDDDDDSLISFSIFKYNIF